MKTFTLALVLGLAFTPLSADDETKEQPTLFEALEILIQEASSEGKSNAQAKLQKKGTTLEITYTDEQQEQEEEAEEDS